MTPLSLVTAYETSVGWTKKHTSCVILKNAKQQFEVLSNGNLFIEFHKVNIK